METLTQKVVVPFEQMYKEAEMVAEHLHSNQTYDDIFPYMKHIHDVVSVMKRYGFSGNYIIVAYLHDGIEDSRLTYNKIKKIFNVDCAEMVLSVTNPSDARNRKEKFAITYKKLQVYTNGIPNKLGDRIANVEHGIRFESDQLEMYRKEYPEFRAKLRPISPDSTEQMWNDLDRLLKFKEQ